MPFLTAFLSKYLLILNKYTGLLSVRSISIPRFQYQCVFIAILLLIGGCSNEFEAYNSQAINAVDVSNKSEYRSLSETTNREPVSLYVLDNVAHMSGIMDSTITHLVQNLLNNYPRVDTIVMNNVLGTLDFSETLTAGRLVRDACLTTVVPANGKITSGGVHFFMSGCKRIVERGGKLGIHTWKYAIYDEEGNIIGGKTASDYPVSSVQHRKYLDYQATMGIPEDFYWFMANTPFDNMHFLSQTELDVYKLRNEAEPIWGQEYRLVIDETLPIKFNTAKFYVNDGVAIMHGKISVRTPIDLVNMLTAHPEVHTLEFGVVPGVLNNANPTSVIDLGYTIREFCLTTKITKNSVVLASGFHAFIAGCFVDFEEGGKLELSSWVKDEADYSALEIDNIHSDFLEFYSDLGKPETLYTDQLEIPFSQPKFVNQQYLIDLGGI